MFGAKRGAAALAAMAESASKAVVADLRSDTVTRPCERMRGAMAGAATGDDVWGDDPTVAALEALGAEVLGKEAALFVTSGTQANLAALLTHCPSRLQEAILGDECHIYHYEAGGYASLAGLSIRPLPTQPDGTLRLDHVEAAIREEDDHYPTTTLLCLENTHNRMGGVVLSKDYIDAACDLAHANNIRVHIDGARLANAAVASRTSMADLVAGADSVSLCLSKGLGAPAGSLLAGSAEFIKTARRIRKLLGGGLRQVGVLAAPGLLALDNIERMEEDHAGAAALASALAKLPGLSLSPVETNIVYIDVDPPVFGCDGDTLVSVLKDDHAILIAGHGNHIRLVTHLDVKPDAIPAIIEAFAAIHASPPSPSSGPSGGPSY